MLNTDRESSIRYKQISPVDAEMIFNSHGVMNKMEVFKIVTAIISGLSLFLYGMGVMSDSLTQIAGGRLSKLLGKITTNRFSGFLAGTILTAIVQSSSATTVLTVGLVNAGILTLASAVGLVIGANLGTTMTAWILSLNALPGGSLIMELCKPSSFTPFLALAGVGLTMFAKSVKKKNIGTILIGFAVMMTGMSMMSGAVAPLKEIPAFRAMLTSFENPLISFLFGILFTMLIQSCDATVGIVQALALSVGVSWGMAVPLVCAAQIGTCITAIMSSMGTSNNGRRTALIHLFYNLFKGIPFLILFFTLNAIFHFPFMDRNVSAVGIPLFHTLINVAAALIYLPVGNLFVRLVEKVIPYSEREKEERESMLTMLDPLLIVEPEIAVRQLNKALIIMAETVSETFSLLGTFDPSEDENSRLYVLCHRIENYEKQIKSYLIDLNASDISEKYLENLQWAQTQCEAFGRMGKLTGDIRGIQKDLKNRDVVFSDRAVSDLHILYDAVREVIEATVVDYQKGSLTLSQTIKYYREAVSSLHRKISKRHIERLHEGICAAEAGASFMDICYSLEKMLDSCDTVAEVIYQHLSTIKTQKDKKKKDPENNAGSGRSDIDKAAYIRDLFRDKYESLLTGEETVQ